MYNQYNNVVQYVDHPILPADVDDGYHRPRIVETNGFYDVWDPHITAADGIVTLLYKLKQDTWIEKLMDVENVCSFVFEHRDDPHLPPLYAERNDCFVEIGLLEKNDRGDRVRRPGVAYGIEEDGRWVASILCEDDDWSEDAKRIHEVSEAIGHGILEEERWKRGIIHTITWTDITEEDELDNEAFLKQFWDANLEAMDDSEDDENDSDGRCNAEDSDD